MMAYPQASILNDSWWNMILSGDIGYKLGVSICLIGGTSQLYLSYRRNTHVKISLAFSLKTQQHILIQKFRFPLSAFETLDTWLYENASKKDRNSDDAKSCKELDPWRQAEMRTITKQSGPGKEDLRVEPASSLTRFHPVKQGTQS